MDLSFYEELVLENVVFWYYISAYYTRKEAVSKDNF
jgi:hypothetical protein